MNNLTRWNTFFLNENSTMKRNLSRVQFLNHIFIATLFFSLLVHQHTNGASDEAGTPYKKASNIPTKGDNYF